MAKNTIQVSDKVLMDMAYNGFDYEDVVPEFNLIVAEIAHWPGNKSKTHKFVLLEVYQSVQGPRSRVCALYATRDQAQYYADNPEAYHAQELYDANKHPNQEFKEER